jgi:uncharacterized protein (TIGR02246 family)
MIGALVAKSRVRSGFAAIMRGDLDEFVSIFTEDGVVNYPTKGDIRGRAAIREFYAHFLQVFPKVDAVVRDVGVQNLFDLVGTNVVFTHFSVSTTNRHGVTYTQEGMQLIRITRGKLTLLHYVFFDMDSLRRAWEESEPEEPR